MQGSERSVEKRTIMDYLPEQERAKIKKLIQRLAEQTEEKQRYKLRYEQMEAKYQQLQKRYQQLEQSNNDLKSQVATSRMAINKAKQAYIASKSAKKIRRVQDDDDSISVEPQQHDNETSVLKQTWLKIPKTHNKNNTASSREKYVFQDNQNNQSQLNFNVTSNQKPYPNIPLPLKTQQSAYKKTNAWKSYKNDVSIHNSSNKKEEIMNLKKQIQNLTEEMQRKQRAGIPLNEKMKKCQQIKNRYLKSKQKAKKKQSSSQSSSQREQSDIEQQQRLKQTKKGRTSKISNPKKAQKIQKQAQPPQRNTDRHKNKNKQQSDSSQNYQQTNEQQISKNKKFMNSKTKRGHKYEQQVTTQQEKPISSKRLARNEVSNRIKENQQQQQTINRTTRSKKQIKKSIPQSKFDDSLFAIIDQLNSGN